MNDFFAGKASKILKDGSVGVMPTDTVYGLVARATDEAAVAKLYRLKERQNKPGTIIAASIDQLEAVGIKRRYLKAVEHFWPNSISVVVPCDYDYLHIGKQAIAVRVPKDKNLRLLLEQTGALLTSSANPPSSPPANNISEAREYFAENVDFYIDGGDLQNAQPSTVVRVVDDAVEVIRKGAVKIDERGEIYDI